MRPSRLARRVAFWGLDRARGGAVARHAADLRRLAAHPDERRALAAERATAALRHAMRHTAYYRRFEGAKRVEDLPVLSKDTIRTRYREFLADDGHRGRPSRVRTSGSYGTPLTFLHDAEKAARKKADLLHFNAWAGYAIGMRHALVRTKGKSRLAQILQNEVLVDATRLDGAWLERHRRLLSEGGIEFLIGHPTPVLALARFCAARGDGPRDFAVHGFISTSEPLHEGARREIEATLGATVVSRYSSEELGVVAHEHPRDRRHHVNEASFLVEVLALDRDEAAPPGEVGRIVVTDLFARALPLLRYDTGDLGVLGATTGVDGLPVLERLEGRVLESVLDARGRRVTPLSLYDALTDLLSGTDVLQYQFEQSGPARYTIRTRGGHLGEEDVARLRRRMRELLGARAEIRFEAVDDIPPLPSGKRPIVTSRLERREPA